MKKTIIRLFFLLWTVLIVGASIWGPEVLSRYKDRSLLGKIYRQEVELAGEGYRYELSAVEKVYVLSQSLGSQMGDYAFIVNQKGLKQGELQEELPSVKKACESCDEGLRALKAAGILPDSVQETDPAIYEAVLYSAIDVREPRNYVAIWKLNLADNIRGLRKENRLMDVYMDADDGKIYEFYARTEWEWENIDPDAIARSWCAYLELPEPILWEDANPLTETTPFFRKYIISGAAEERTIMTVGFYEGIREFFIKVSG
jgi:hypothetical protein